MKKIDLTNKKIGRWKVLKEGTRDKNNHLRWLCKCECGVIKEVAGSSLRQGKSNSCGCLKSNLQSERNFKHGESDTRLYKIWGGIKSRVLNENDTSFEYYGGRGITICDEWIEFIPFRDWSLTNGYNDELSIDRIDVDGNYEPSNCRWISMEKQMSNMTTNNLITYNGKTKTLTEWSHSLGIKRSTLSHRINHQGMSIQEVIRNETSSSRY